MAKKPNKKNKGQKAKNFNNSQNAVVAPDVKDDMMAEETIEAAKIEETSVEAKAEPVKENKVDKKGKKESKSKKQAKKEPKPNKVKESVAELKKVTWPTFPKVVKNTLLVLGIVLLFTIVLFGIDYGLSWIYKLLTPAA